MAESTYEELLTFFYRSPIALIQILPTGDVELITPPAVALLLPLAGNSNLDNLFHVLDPIAPQIQHSIATDTATSGVVCDSQYVTIDSSIAEGHNGLVLSISIFKICADKLIVMLRDVTKEVHCAELERKESNLALHAERSERLKVTESLSEKECMLIQQSRLAAMGEMIGNIAHQWRQPLNTLGIHMQSLGIFYGTPNFNKEFLDKTIAKSMETIKHMSKTIDDFRGYFRPDKAKTDFYVIEAIKNTLSLLEGCFDNPKITIDFVELDNPVVNGYRNEFAQVFLNILNNAKDALIERKINDAKVTITICSEVSCAVITVADNAGGIPDEVIDKVFDPYFTTKCSQEGTGIGLSMSKSIIEKNMGGILSVRNTEEGAEFRIEVRHGTYN
jgi:C4-dicarboxylate-specific signal transduction histidine kinase